MRGGRAPILRRPVRRFTGCMTIAHPPKPDTALWVYAHPRRDSLNDRLLQAGTKALSQRYDVAVSDLYAQGFDPVLSDRDLGDLADRRGNIAELAGEAYATGQLPADVLAE